MNLTRGCRSLCTPVCGVWVALSDAPISSSDAPRRGERDEAEGFLIRPVSGHWRRFYGLGRGGRGDLDGDVTVPEEERSGHVVRRIHADAISCRLHDRVFEADINAGDRIATRASSSKCQNRHRSSGEVASGRRVSTLTTGSEMRDLHFRW